MVFGKKSVPGSKEVQQESYSIIYRLEKESKYIPLRKKNIKPVSIDEIQEFEKERRNSNKPQNPQ